MLSCSKGARGTSINHWQGLSEGICEAQCKFPHKPTMACTPKCQIQRCMYVLLTVYRRKLLRTSTGCICRCLNFNEAREVPHWCLAHGLPQCDPIWVNVGDESVPRWLSPRPSYVTALVPSAQPVLKLISRVACLLASHIIIALVPPMHSYV
jgi:hypothetical protein